MNQKFYAYAAAHEHFYINDIDYLSADYGLTAWGDAFFWHMYKYAMCLDAIPSLANSAIISCSLICGSFSFSCSD